MAYEYLDKKKELYEKYVKNGDFIFHHVESNNDMELLKFELQDRHTKKILLRGSYSTIGFYNNFLSTWYWGWAVPFPIKSENYLSRKMLMYALDIDILQNENANVDSILKAELLNSKIFMENHEIEIEKYVALSIYITKSDYFHKIGIQSVNVITHKNENIGEVYYFLRNIEIVQNV